MYVTKRNLGNCSANFVSMPIANYMELKAKASPSKPRMIKYLGTIA
jgi:hypothetical protein